MNFDDLKNMYREIRRQEGARAYKSVSQLLKDAKERHKQDFLKDKPEGDHEQSWRSFKGKNFEKLIQYIITESIEALGLKIANGDRLDRSKKLPQELDSVKRNVSIHYAGFGLQLPDADIIVYDPNDFQIVAVISSKTSLRERIAQTGYWKLKLLESGNTAHIKVYLITADTDKDLTKRYPTKKPRVIAEVELDGTYVLTEENLVESDKVKLFEHFIEDFEQFLSESQ